jgi:hypothetical protein
MLKGKDLAREIKSALENLDPAKEGDTIRSKYQDTIKTYLEKNIDITLSYEGAIPGTPPTPDLEPSFKGKLTFPTFDFLPAPTKEAFDLNLSTAVKGGLISNGDESNGITFPPLAFNPAGMIVTVFPSFDATDKNASVDDFMEKYCDSILNQIKTGFISITPSLGARLTKSSTGAVTMVTIQ